MLMRTTECSTPVAGTKQCWHANRSDYFENHDAVRRFFSAILHKFFPNRDTIPHLSLRYNQPAFQLV